MNPALVISSGTLPLILMHAMYDARINLFHGGRIDSWRAIAAFLGRDERTVQRWEKERLLPVHRQAGERGNVFAYKSELLRWLHATPVASGGGTFSLQSSLRKTQPVRGASQPAHTAALEEALSTIKIVGRDASSGGVRWTFWVIAAAFALLLFSADSYHARVEATPEPDRHGSMMTAASGSAPGTLSQPLITNTDRQQARESYLRGRYYWNRRTGESLERARDEFTQAIVHDAGYAEAYAGLAATYELMPQYSPVPVSEAFPRGLAAARRAVVLEPTSAEAHRVLGFGLFYWEWNVRAAFADFHRAMELDPNDAEAHHWYATALLTLRRSAEARVEIERARDLNPASRAILADQILIESASGADPSESLSKLKELERAEPDFMSPPRYMDQILFARGDYAAWVVELRKTANLSRNAADLTMARAAERGWFHGGEHGLFTEVRKAQQQMFDEGLASGYDLALTCMHLGDKPAAVRFLQAAYNSHDFRLLSLVHDPADASLRGMDAYEALRHMIESRIDQPA